MSTGLPYDHIAELSLWLAEANIDSLELIGPEGRLYLRRSEGESDLQVEKDAPVESETGESRRTVLTAPIAGVLRHSHPMQEAPLATEHSPVRAGQALALLQIGTLLVPVLAPHAGHIGAWQADDGTLIGFADPVVEIFSGEGLAQERHDEN